MTYTFVMADRTGKSLLLWDLANQLEGWDFPSGEVPEIIFKLCPLGLDQARGVDMIALRRVLHNWHDVPLNAKISFQSKEAP